MGLRFGRPSRIRATDIRANRDTGNRDTVNNQSMCNLVPADVAWGPEWGVRGALVSVYVDCGLHAGLAAIKADLLPPSCAMCRIAML